MDIEHDHSFTNDLTGIGQDWVDHRNSGHAESIECLIKKQTFDMCERLEAILTELRQMRERFDSQPSSPELCDRLDDIADELRSHNSREEIRDATS